MSPARTRLVAAGTVLALVPLAACSGGGSHSAAAPAAARPVSAEQWWSKGADYCSTLRQTVQAGRSILPGVGAADPTRLASTKAFVAEVEHLAPAAVADDWRVLGPAVIKIVASGGHLAGVKGVDAAAVQQAATAIAAHAKQTCHVDVSRAAPAS